MNGFVSGLLATYLALLFVVAAFSKVLAYMRRGSLIQFEVELVRLGIPPRYSRRSATALVVVELALGVVLLVSPSIGFPLSVSFLLIAVAVPLYLGMPSSYECRCFGSMLTFGGSSHAILARNCIWLLLTLSGWLAGHISSCSDCNVGSRTDLGILAVALCAFALTLSLDMVYRARIMKVSNYE